MVFEKMNLRILGATAALSVLALAGVPHACPRPKDPAMEKELQIRRNIDRALKDGRLEGAIDSPPGTYILVDKSLTREQATRKYYERYYEYTTPIQNKIDQEHATLLRGVKKVSNFAKWKIGKAAIQESDAIFGTSRLPFHENISSGLWRIRAIRNAVAMNLGSVWRSWRETHEDQAGKIDISLPARIEMDVESVEHFSDLHEVYTNEFGYVWKSY